MKKSLSLKIFLFIFSISLAFFALFPFLQIVSISLKTPLEWGRPNLIPRVLNLAEYKEMLSINPGSVDMDQVPENVKKVLSNPKITDEQRQTILKRYSKDSTFPFLRYMLNSFILAILSSFTSLIISVFGAYSISRLQFRGKKLIQRSVLFVYLLGGIVIMVPLYQMANGLLLTRTKSGIVLTLLLIYILQTLPLALYMLGNYMRGLPISLDEAARIDGCSNMKIIFEVIVPLSRPIIATVFIYCFIISWNEYLYASVFLRGKPDLYTIPVGIRSLFVSKNAIWARIMAASTLTLAPILLFFGVLSKNMQKGMIEGGVKE